MLAMLWAAMCWGWALAKDLPYTSLSLLSNYPKTFSTIAGVSRDPGVKGGREGGTQHWPNGKGDLRFSQFDVIAVCVTQ